MKFFETGIIIFFTLWLSWAVWVALYGKGRFLKLRNFLWFNGWFNQWTMFIPAKNERTQSFTISYRDKMNDGNIGAWQVIALEKTWKPYLFLINPDLRLYGFLLKAIRSFGLMHDSKRPPSESKLFSFFQCIILSYHKNEQAERRQIKVERSTNEKEEILLQSEFLRLP